MLISELHLDEVKRDSRAQPSRPVDALVSPSIRVNSERRRVVASGFIIREVKDRNAQWI